MIFFQIEEDRDGYKILQEDLKQHCLFTEAESKYWDYINYYGQKCVFASTDRKEENCADKAYT